MIFAHHCMQMRKAVTGTTKELQRHLRQATLAGVDYKGSDTLNRFTMGFGASGFE